MKRALAREGYCLSRRRIGQIIKRNGLVSVYTKKKYKNQKGSVNEANTANIIGRQFNDRIIGYSCGPQKDARLVHEAFSSTKRNLAEITYFHTDRGSEFDNEIIEEVLLRHNIKRLLSHKGCPYDNAVAEASFKILKTEFVYPRWFENLDQLRQELAAYVYWFNNIRLHSTLDYIAPVQYREKQSLLFLSKKVLPYHFDYA